jgi:cation-transporting ATPase E
MKDFLVIVRRNFVTPIVIAILTLAAILLILHEPRDAWFISFVIVVNTVFAIVQEVRAQRALKKLELLNQPVARRVNSDGLISEVAFDTLVVGDHITVQSGDELPADGEILSSAGLEVDESMLTGESAAIEKQKKDVIYAASVVMAGSADVIVTAVGSTTKVGVMSATLKRYTPRPTPLQRAIGRAITWLTYGALILAVLIFTVYTLSGLHAVVIFKTITSAAVTIVPEGLLLASSLLLAFGSLRLAQAKVLPQKLGAIEAMALLTVLCVDKTGTLTSDSIEFESLEVFKGAPKELSQLIGIVAHETSKGNITGDAIIAANPIIDTYETLDILAFSSARKMSGIKVTLQGKTRIIVMGAPEFLTALAPLSKSQQTLLDLLTSNGQRVLLVAEFDGSQHIKKLTPGSGTAQGLIVLSNQLRAGVEKTVAYLQDKGVSIRVISGDTPNTVRYIAERAGINNTDKMMTGAELATLSAKAWDTTVKQTTIFARVLPEQKERLIETFRADGQFTGMVGDGVNDALAIKKADLGVAMYAGASATRRVADVVLMNNSFNSLPIGIKLGNRIIQAIVITASLFFHKMIYGVVLLLATLVLGMVYPFEPRHVTFMNIFLVTLPTIMWTLFTPIPRTLVSPKYFWKDTFQAVAPIAVITGTVVTITYGYLRAFHPTNLMGVSTTTVLVATLFGVYLVFLVPRLFDVRNTRTARLARILYICAVITVIIPSFGFSFARDFFDFTAPAWSDTWPLAILIFGAMILQWYIAKKAGQRFKIRATKK